MYCLNKLYKNVIDNRDHCLLCDIGSCYTTHDWSKLILRNS